MKAIIALKNITAAGVCPKKVFVTAAYFYVRLIPQLIRKTFGSGSCVFFYKVAFSRRLL